MRKKRMHIPKYIAAIIAALVLIAGGFALFCRLHVDQSRAEGIVPVQDMQSVTKADYIIVPACAINDGVMSYHMQDRIDSAIRLVKAGKAKKMLLSGGYSQSSKAYEAEILRDYAVRMGVPNDAVIVDNGGLDTLDTMSRAKEYFGEKTALICTQDQYAARTLYLAKAAGIPCTLVGSDIQEYGPNIFNDVREFFAATKAFIDVQMGSGAGKTLEQLPYETQ